MEKKLYCGAARRVVNPPEDVIRRIHRKPDRSTTILDDLCLRVIAVSDGHERFLLISYDSGYSCVDEQFALLEREFGIDSDHVMVFDCHSHTKLYGGYQFGNLPPNPRRHYQEFYTWPKEEQDAMNEYGVMTRKLLKEAAAEALNNMRPARMGHASGKSYVNVCRNQKYDIGMPDGSIETRYTIGYAFGHDVDHTVFVMKFEDAETGDPIAFFINYPVHNCVMIDNKSGADGKKAFSGDIGGKCCHYMEDKFPGSVAMWSSGPAGNINPIFGTELMVADPMTGEPEHIDVKTAETGNVMLMLLSTRHFADIMETERSISHMTDRTELKCAVEILKTPGLDGENNIHEDLYKIRMQNIHIGDVSLLGFSGELYDSFGKYIRSISPMKNTVLVTHVGVGTCQSEYILSDWVFRHSASDEERQSMGPRDGDAARKGLSSCIVGTEHSQIVPGYLKEAFRKHTLSLFDKVL